MVSLDFVHLFPWAPLNVQWIVRDISQQYPPKRDKFLLESASNAHWTRSSSVVVEFNLPDIDECIIYGKEWLDQLNKFIELQRTGNKLLSYPRKLRKWIAAQRWAYALKYDTSCKSHDTLGKVKAVKTLTDCREQKLKDNNFIFSLARDEGQNQERWDIMFQEAREHKEKHGSLRVS